MNQFPTQELPTQYDARFEIAMTKRSLAGNVINGRETLVVTEMKNGIHPTAVLAEAVAHGNVISIGEALTLAPDFGLTTLTPIDEGIMMAEGYKQLEFIKGLHAKNEKDPNFAEIKRFQAKNAGEMAKKLSDCVAILRHEQGNIKTREGN